MGNPEELRQDNSKEELALGDLACFNDMDQLAGAAALSKNHEIKQKDEMCCFAFDQYAQDPENPEFLAAFQRGLAHLAEQEKMLQHA